MPLNGWSLSFPAAHTVQQDFFSLDEAMVPIGRVPVNRPFSALIERALHALTVFEILGAYSTFFSESCMHICAATAITFKGAVSA